MESTMLFLDWWHLFISLLLSTQLLAYPTTLPYWETGNTAIDKFPRPIRKRQYANGTASVQASMLAPESKYWHVTAMVNGKPVSLMADTGSSDFWLKPGPNTPSPNGTTSGAPIMQHDGQNASFNIAYATQSNSSTSGPVVSTSVQLGSLTVPNFGVGVATKMAFGYPLDGFMGLAFKGLNTVQPVQQPTLMEAAQSSLQNPVFTVGLRPNDQGTINFGYVDPSLYQGNLITAPVNTSQASWTIDNVTLSAGNTSVQQSMLFDTGASDTMYADSTFVNNFWSQVSGATNEPGFWIYPCAAYIPNMAVSIAPDQYHEILGSTFNGGSTSEGVCKGALQATDNGWADAGAPFFLTFFVVFNQAAPSISFANQP